ncbi:MAG: hypothetical protein ABSG90_12645 [Dehalococcoidia bacterium]|jgi:hypothetical protein
MADWGIGEYAAVTAAAATVTGTTYTLMSAPKMPTLPAQPSSADTEAAAYAQAIESRKRQGAASTILTSPLGVGGTPQTQRATLGT